MLRPLTQGLIRQALSDAREIETVSRYSVDSDTLLLMATILCLRPTESVVMDVEYKQLTEEKRTDA